MWWSGKHKHHGGNVQVIATPDGWRIWISRYGTAVSTTPTRARHHGLTDALDRISAEPGIPALVDLGYENAGPGFRHPVKKQAGGELTEAQQTYNKVIRGIHGCCERLLWPHGNDLGSSTPAVLRGLTWGNVERWECSGREVVTDGFCPHVPRRSAPDGKVAPGLGSLGS
ncbi:transposase family protein [Streptomyces sp. NPDC020898]|uniref:transposase family protein n=1 Tax=Streptomyces sp. NPDC020898 TaxID=3365101 RepID=UPI00378E300F